MSEARWTRVGQALPQARVFDDGLGFLRSADTVCWSGAGADQQIRSLPLTQMATAQSRPSRRVIAAATHQPARGSV